METIATCILGLSAFESKPDTFFPSFVLKYGQDDDAIDDMIHADTVQLDLDPMDGVSSTIILTATTDECEAGEDYEEDIEESTAVIKYSTSSKSIEKFFHHAAASSCFIWILSTPTVEAKILVDFMTQKVVQKHINERILH
jgi:hypothetical protein